MVRGNYGHPAGEAPQRMAETARVEFGAVDNALLCAHCLDIFRGMLHSDGF